MEIGIIGSGSMGKALASELSKKHHTITLGTRRPAAIKEWVAKNDLTIRTTTYVDAAQSNEILFLVTAWKETHAIVMALGDVSGKILVDCTNPEDPDNNYEHPRGTEVSWSEEIASWIPTAKVVKAFNHVYGSLLTEGTDFKGLQPSLFYCGDDADAKTKVASLANDLGLDPIDSGGLRTARQLEPLAELLVHLASRPGSQGNELAFKLLRR